MGETEAYASFLVRIFRTGAADLAPGDSGWRGEIEQIQSGQTWRVDSRQALAEFWRTGLEEAAWQKVNANG